MAKQDSAKNMNSLKISNWTVTPGPRYKRIGPNSGEELRDAVLLPALKNAINLGEKLYIDLDGTMPYGSSFLDEAFGGLIYRNGFSRSKVLKNVQLVSPTRPWLIKEVMGYINEAEEKVI